MSIKNKVQLITYPDSLGGDLKKLNEVLNKYFFDIFRGGIHILPPFPSSGDRGFAPLTYLKIDPKFGTWEDIGSISENFDVLLDLMVNHISRKSEYFQDFLEKGKKSKYADLFITIDKVWPDASPSNEELSKIFLRRATPFSKFTIKETGEKETIWTTFGKCNPSEQIDFDINAEITRQLFIEFFQNFNRNNVKIIRLDAVGYVIKKAGTSCFFVEPEMYEFLEWITKIAKSLNIDLLPEVHSHYSTQFKLVENGYWIYDFILPYLILETFFNKSSTNLCKYIKTRPHKQFTMLDCHDGVPVKPDMDDLYESEDAKELVNTCMERGANLSFVFSPKHKDPDGFDVHQIRATYYSLLDCDDDAYLAARAMQFFVPGIPQVYYVGLLAGKNDEKRAKLIGEGREINRHNYTIEEIDKAIQQDVVQRLLKLIRFRNEYPAFDGNFKVLESKKEEVNLLWQKDNKSCHLKVDLKTNKSAIDYIDDTGNMIQYLI